MIELKCYLKKRNVNVFFFFSGSAREVRGGPAAPTFAHPCFGAEWRVLAPAPKDGCPLRTEDDIKLARLQTVLSSTGVFCNGTQELPTNIKKERTRRKKKKRKETKEEVQHPGPEFFLGGKVRCNLLSGWCCHCQRPVRILHTPYISRCSTITILHILEGGIEFHLIQ